MHEAYFSRRQVFCSSTRANGCAWLDFTRHRGGALFDTAFLASTPTCYLITAQGLDSALLSRRPVPRAKRADFLDARK